MEGCSKRSIALVLASSRSNQEAAQARAFVGFRLVVVTRLGMGPEVLKRPRGGIV